MSAKAIKFIKDMAKDYQKGTLAHQQERAKDGTRSEKPASVAESVPLHEPEVMDLLDSLIKEATYSRHNASKQGFSYPQAHGNEKSQDAHITEPMTLLREELASNERSQNSFLVSVLKPQVCLCSEIGGQSSTVVIASQAVQLRICAVIDIDYIDDPINATVMHRSFGRIDALQVFYPHLRGWRSGRKESLLSHANAFVPLELLAGLASNTRDLDTIVAPTNAQLTYDKNNRLRLVNQTKKTSDVRAGGCDRTVDRFNVACDRFTVNATSVHFAAIYDVVTNLILYTDPSQKEVTQKTEELVLSQDFSDTADILRSVEKQQDILREHKRTYHKLLEAGPDSHTSSTDLHIDLMQRSAEMTGRKDVLTLWLKALQQAQANRSTTKGTGLRLDARAQEIVWHMREGDGKPLAKVAVNGVYFCWQNRSDGGVSNSLVIRDLNALNSGPDPYFSEIISKHPYSPTVMETRFMRADIFVAVIWSMLSPVGGIPIIDHFQVHLHPIRLQMEQSMADKIKHYFFTPREPRGSDEGQLAIAHENNSNSKASIPSNSDGSPNKNGQLQQLKVFNPSTESLGKPSQNGTKRPPSVTSQLLSFPSSTSSQVSLQSSRPRSVIKMHETSLKSIVTRDDHLDADDMRERARSNRTFLHVELFPTVLCLSFKVCDLLLWMACLDMN